MGARSPTEARSLLIGAMRREWGMTAWLCQARLVEWRQLHHADGALEDQEDDRGSRGDGPEAGEQPEQALVVFEAMQQRDLEPTLITYNAVISACAAGKQLEQAVEMFHSMQRQVVEPDIITYKALISPCEKGKQPTQAVDMFQAMQRQIVVPDITTYNTLISTCEKGKQPEQAVEMFHAMQQ